MTAPGPAPAPAGDAAIVVEGLTRDFGALRAVDSLSLRVPRGAFLGFLGPNGAGKSTTLRMLTGLLRPTAGTARILGHDVVRDPVPVKARIGVVPEGFALFERLTAEEFLSFSGRMRGLDPETIRERSRELLELLDLRQRARDLIVDYSHGMKKKLSFAAALLHGPEVLFLDEPFEGVDAISSRSIRDVLTALTGRGATVFLTSHVLDIVERLCDSVAILDRGILLAHGTLEDLRRGVEVGGGEGARHATLEEIFLGLVGGEKSGGTLSWIG